MNTTDTPLVPGQTALDQAATRPVVFRDVKLLPPAARQLLEEYFIEGASLEGAVEAINENDDFQVTLSAVAHHFRSRIDLQCRRVQYITATAAAITEGLPGDPASPENRLMDVLIMGGLVKVNEQDGSGFLNSMIMRRLEGANLVLKNRLMRWKEKENVLREKQVKAQTGLLVSRQRLITEQTKKLGDFVKKLERKRNITPETLQKIQDIYGILKKDLALAAADANAASAPPEPSLAEGDGIETQAYYTSPVDIYESGKTQFLERVQEGSSEPGQREE